MMSTRIILNLVIAGLILLLGSGSGSVQTVLARSL